MAQWASFSKEKLKQVIAKCNDSLALGPDKLSWQHLKIIMKQDKCLTNIINIANYQAQFTLGWKSAEWTRR